MTTYWCSWCGATMERSGPDEGVRCTRCVWEAIALFGFYPRTLMVPLRPGQEPGTPKGALRRFEFRDARTGEVVTATDAIPASGFGRLAS